MRRVLRAFPFTIAAILVLGGGIAFAAHSVLTTTTGPVPPVHAPGMPALKPAFTESAVRAYLATNPFSLGRTLSGGPAQISSVQYMTGAQADALLEGATGAAPNATVCVVKFAGPLVAIGKALGPYTALPAVTPGQPTPTPHGRPIYSGGYMVFDATTGNLLEEVI